MENLVVFLLEDLTHFAPLSAKGLCHPSARFSGCVIVKQVCSSAKAIFEKGRKAKLEIPLRGLPVRCLNRTGVFWTNLFLSSFLKELSGSQVNAHEQEFVCR
jgi:hypothetical protein